VGKGAKVTGAKRVRGNAEADIKFGSIEEAEVVGVEDLGSEQ
jgi:hypothetical protein